MSKKTFPLMRYHPLVDLLVQEASEAECNGILNELLGLVRIAEIPEGTRMHLSRGVARLRHHIQEQTRLVKSDIVGRNC